MKPIPVTTTYLLDRDGAEVEYTIKAEYTPPSTDPEDVEAGHNEPTVEIISILRPDGTEVENWGDEGFNDDTIDDIMVNIEENPPEEKPRPEDNEDSWPADMSRPSKIVSTGNKMEGDRKHLPEPPRHRSPLPSRTGGPMGKRTDYKPAERQRVRKDIERELDYREAAETALATDIKEIAKKEVLVHTPAGDVQFDVWDDVIDPSADSVEVRNYVDLKTGTTRSSLKYPMAKLQKFLDAGDVEIIGSQKARSLAEQLELLTRALSRFCL